MVRATGTAILLCVTAFWVVGATVVPSTVPASRSTRATPVSNSSQPIITTSARLSGLLLPDLNNLSNTLTVPFGGSDAQKKYAQICGLGEDYLCEDKAGICLLGDPACSHPKVTATIDAPQPVPDLTYQCRLWNTSCSEAHGQQKAIYAFFHNTQFNLQANSCFMNYSLDCSAYETKEMLAEFKDIKNWMRQSDCLASSTIYDSLAGLPLPTQAAAGDGVSCCNICDIEADNVDVYYWPSPKADTSCLSVIGKSLPIDYGATTAKDGNVYWGCTVPNAGPYDAQYIATAAIESVGPITYKRYLDNPWDPPSCTGNAASSLSPQPSEAKGGGAITAAKQVQGAQSGSQTASQPKSTVPSGNGHQPAMQARAHSILVPRASNHTNASVATTVVSGSFTL